MQLEANKIIITPEKFAINNDLYFFLKVLNSTEAKFTQKDRDAILALYYAHSNTEFESLHNIITVLFFDAIKAKRKSTLLVLWAQVQNSQQLDLLIFALKLLTIKPLLLNEIRLRETFNLHRFGHFHPLSLAYDTISKNRPYAKRVGGALLTLAFFEKLEDGEVNFMTQDAASFLHGLVKDYHALKALGVEANQMFMLMFTESVNQAITSDAGASYEDRIQQVLLSLGIRANKVHDDKDKSTEYDFFFTLNNKNYGIGAKRTLRERYKQFIKTAQTSHIDVMIQITTGEDLTPEKARIIRQHGVYLFIADEVYAREKSLQKLAGIFPANKLTLETLYSLG